MQSDVVALRQQRIEVDQFHAEIPATLGIHVRIEADHAHFERLGAPHHLASNAAEPNHSQHLLAEFTARAKRRLSHFPDLIELLACGIEARQREHQRQSVLGYRDGVAPPGVFITSFYAKLRWRHQYRHYRHLRQPGQLP